ncbi:MAG: DegT/DnrJ/EryC1/StrS family aminotransferase [Planctomycetota bacterium]
MIPRKQLDIGWTDLIAAFGRSLVPLDRLRLGRELETAWKIVGASRQTTDPPPRDNSSTILTALSVRSGFDATLTALDWPPGSEVLVSAITIRDMPRILVEHGLRAVPVDVDMGPLAVPVGNLARAVTPQTRGILVAHLFGSQMSMQPIIDFAREHGLLVFEDCAQAYTGDGNAGHPESDVRLFSFGPIKTATALGGAVLTFHDAGLRNRAEAIQVTWPIQSRSNFLRRVLRFGMFKFVSSRLAFTIFANGCRWLGVSHDDVLSRGVRGFAGGDFFQRIRRRPSSPLLSLLLRRLRQHHGERLARRRVLAQEFDTVLNGIDRPGRAARDHSFWVYPIHHDRPDELMQHLWQAGFDATRGASSMGLVEPSSSDAPQPRAASESLRRLLYLPFDPSMTAADVRRLGRAMSEFDEQLAPHSESAGY